MRTLWLFLLVLCPLSASALVLVDDSNLCEECDCDEDLSLAKCIFSSGKSRLVSMSGVERSSWALRLSGHAEIQLKDVHVRSLHLSGFSSAMFESGRLFPNSTEIVGVGSLELKPKSSSGSMDVHNVSRVSVEEHAFLNLKSFRLENISDVLLLEDEALKSRGSSFSRPESIIVFNRVAQIPKIPHNAFSLSHSVLIQACNVTLIQEFAFGGISIHNVTFADSLIRRLERHAFPDMTLIRHLSFRGCELSSLAAESITSAISALTFEACKVTSISGRAFTVLAAAQVLFRGNHLPLKSRSLVFKTWSVMEFHQNDFEFLEKEAFLGVSHPTEGKSRLIFTQNRIRYANRGALEFRDFGNGTEVEVGGNAFDQTCECFYPSWLSNVVGENEAHLGAFLNSSSCRLSERDASCRSFSSGSPAITSYLSEACGRELSNSAAEEEDPCNNPWILLRERFRPDRDQGILLILLTAAVLLSVVLSIYTFIRWIFFLLSRGKEGPSKEEEWNFTQIEPLKPPETPSSGLNHYDTPGEPLVSPQPHDEEDKKSVHRKSTLLAVGGPTLTFYDEMIGFIKEKLDDPDNYATVSDNAPGDEYADPFDEKD